MRQVLRRLLTAGVAVGVALGTGVVAAPTASAGQPITWHQAVGVPSATSSCPATTAAEAAAGWSEWTNSWAAWPHDGKGGFVCERANTWAYTGTPDADDVVYPSAGCTRVHGELPIYVQFGGGWKLPALTTPVYRSSDCATPDPTDELIYDIVYSPIGADANSLCLTAWGKPVNEGAFGDNVYSCGPKYQ